MDLRIRTVRVAGASVPARLLAAALAIAASLTWGWPAAVNARPPQLGEAATDFALTDVSGKEVRLSALRGHPILLTFWASWCEPCKAEMPEIQKAYERHKDRGFVVLAVNFGEKSEKAKTFTEARGLSFPVLVDRRANVASQYSVVSLPVSLFIDSEGVVRERVFGGTLTAGTIDQILQRLLTPPPPKSSPFPLPKRE